MFKKIRLAKRQWARLASALSNISQAIIIFSLGVIFVPEAVSLKQDFPRLIGFIYLFWGLFILIASVIITKKED